MRALDRSHALWLWKPKHVTCLLLPRQGAKGGVTGDALHQPVLSPLISMKENGPIPSRCCSAEEPGWVLLGDPWAQVSHSWGSRKALQWHLLLNKMSSAMLTQGESETKGAAASNSQRFRFSGSLGDKGLCAYGPLLSPGG